MRLTLSIVGLTASGKSTLAVQIAEALSGEIVCMDSTTIYRRFDIGTAKPNAKQRARVPHHLLDQLEPEKEFSAYEFVRLADQTLHEIEERGRLPIVVGGTYFYLRALEHGMTESIDHALTRSIEAEYDASPDSPIRLHQELAQIDPEAARQIHLNDRYRLARALAWIRATGLPSSVREPRWISPHQAGRYWLKYATIQKRTHLAEQIEKRVHEMLERGLLDEVETLLKEYPNARALHSVGYKEAVRYLRGEIPRAALIPEMVSSTRSLAKRQMTWLRSDPALRFVSEGDGDQILAEVSNLRQTTTRRTK